MKIVLGLQNKLRSGLKTIPKNHQLVETDDGSFTLYSKTYDENLHSTSGAEGETLQYFIKNSLIKDIKDNGIIFETGFGMGLSFKKLLNSDLNQALTFISTEIDEDLVSWFEKSEDLIFEKDENLRIAQIKNIKIIIILGDAKLMAPIFFKKNNLKVDRFFQDPFSPKKNPTLWDLEWFEFLSSIAEKNSILTTYSASHSVKKNLESTGWEVESMPGYGKKRSSTRAYYRGKI